MDSNTNTESRHDRMEDLERRLERLENKRSAVDRSRDAARVIVPEETRRHLRAAGREQLLAVRSLLDHWINRMRDEPAAAQKGRESIKVE